MFEELNIDVPEDLYASFTGMATMPICEKICYFLSLNQSPETLVDTKRKYFSGLFEKGYKLNLIEGVLELIKHYYENGITFSINYEKITHKDRERSYSHQDTILFKFGRINKNDAEFVMNFNPNQNNKTGKPIPPKKPFTRLAKP